MQPKDSEELLNRFKSTTEKALESAITSGLSIEDFENNKRRSNLRLIESWDDLKRFLHRIAGISILVLTFLFFIILLRFLWDVVQNPDESKSLLKEIWNAVLIAGGTLFIQHAISKK